MRARGRGVRNPREHHLGRLGLLPDGHLVGVHAEGIAMGCAALDPLQPRIPTRGSAYGVELFGRTLLTPTTRGGEPTAVDPDAGMPISTSCCVALSTNDSLSEAHFLTTSRC